MMGRIISVSAAPYDGYPVADMLDSLAACGATHVEPAYIVGYTEPFDESAFSDDHARRYAGWLNASGVACHAFSSHINLGGTDAVAVFRGRMDFACRIGAEVINTNAAVCVNEAAFFRNIESLIRHAETLGMVIGLENPGDGRASLFNVAADGLELVERIGSSNVRLNYDPANTASHRPEVDAIADAISALPACGHLHLKAVRHTQEGWHFLSVGDGDLDDARLLDGLRPFSDLAISIEMPLRMRRGEDAQPWRRVAAVDRDRIESSVRASLAFVRRELSRRGRPAEAV